MNTKTYPTPDYVATLLRVDNRGDLWWKTSTRGHKANVLAGSMLQSGYRANILLERKLTPK